MTIFILLFSSRRKLQNTYLSFLANWFSTTAFFLCKIHHFLNTVREKHGKLSISMKRHNLTTNFRYSDFASRDAKVFQGSYSVVDKRIFQVLNEPLSERKIVKVIHLTLLLSLTTFPSYSSRSLRHITFCFLFKQNCSSSRNSSPLFSTPIRSLIYKHFFSYLVTVR